MRLPDPIRPSIRPRRSTVSALIEPLTEPSWLSTRLPAETEPSTSPMISTAPSDTRSPVMRRSEASTDLAPLPRALGVEPSDGLLGGIVISLF